MSHVRIKISTTVAGALLAALALTAATGCAPRSRLELVQPFAPPSQQCVELASDWAYQAADGQRQTWLLAYPLPGSETGLRAYALYLSAPDRTGTLRVDRQAPEGMRGFLVQEVGHLAGRTDVVAGTVTCKRPMFGADRRKLQFDLECEDGTVIRGKATVRGTPSEIRAFEQAYELDVLGLNAEPPAANEQRPRRTAPRNNAGD
jgi:hypothetical protein